MVWHRKGGKPLPEPVMTVINDAIRRHEDTLIWRLLLYLDEASLSTVVPAFVQTSCVILFQFSKVTLISRFMGPTWGPSGADRAQVGPMLAPWILLSGYLSIPCDRKIIFLISFYHLVLNYVTPISSYIIIQIYIISLFLTYSPISSLKIIFLLFSKC